MDQRGDQSIEKTVKSEMIYEGRILNLRVETVELPNQKYSKREIVDHSKAVALVVLDKEEIFLVRQYRKAIDDFILEIPAGLVESNEQPRETALREMQEEIGYGSNHLEYLFDAYSSPGFTNEKTSFFFTNDIYEGKKEGDDDEFLEIVKMPFERVIEMIDTGEITDSKTIMGVLYVKKMMDNGQI
ncbi:MAG: NUDIX hydrolase [Tissierellia bacterium]|nr:NUDIX hydrolase [Tissierellia bacterium]